ncbi:MAG: periplasmic heavy metal sensor [Pseudomonadota bacterium]
MVDFLRRNVAWLAIALLISLGLNLFMGGAFAGRFFHYRFGPPDRFGPPPIEAMSGPGQVRWLLRRIAGDLPGDERAAFRQAMESRRDALVARGKDLREAREAVRSAIEARPFDRAAYDAAVATLGERQKAFANELSDAIGDALELAAGSPPAPGGGSTGQ